MLDWGITGGAGGRGGQCRWYAAQVEFCDALIVVKSLFAQSATALRARNDSPTHPQHIRRTADGAPIRHLLRHLPATASIDNLPVDQRPTIDVVIFIVGAQRANRMINFLCDRRWSNCCR